MLRELGEPNNKFQDYLKDTNTHIFFLKETTTVEVQKLLNNTNTRKASDIYGTLPKLVKPSSEHIIIEHINHGCIFLGKLKSAVIYSINKGETKVFYSSYRPISTLPIFSKIIENWCIKD